MKKLIASRQYLIKAVSISIAIGFTGIPSAFGQEIIKGPLADAKSIKTEDDTILNLRFSPSGKLLAWHNSQGLTVRSLDPKSVSLRIKPRFRTINSVSFSNDEKYLYVSDHGDLVVYDLSNPNLQSIHKFKAYANALAVSPDGGVLAVGGIKCITLWNTKTKRVIRTLTGLHNTPHAMRWTSDSKQLLVGDHDSTIKLWDIATGKVVASYEGLSEGQVAASMYFTKDDTVVVNCVFDQTFQWSLRTKKMISKTTDDELYGMFLAGTYIPTTGHLVTATDNVVRFIDLKKNRIVNTWDAPYRISSLACSPDGKTLAIGYGSRTGEGPSLIHLVPLNQ